MIMNFENAYIKNPIENKKSRLKRKMHECLQ